ncbi:alpha/beta hydrolase family protein [Streptomyces sp. 840.1]|uniref:alpha/beta hydrolase n=1 Tax=Streptomyces sp. 840.1 TaxID=2485152 RepID=UPI000F46C949|nr:alpha/beta hydrolase [Streptomyces sp. 840.1]ROQ63652.1 alpha/beta hydrolase family protein [Streptomyces sp. 840.1]
MEPILVLVHSPSVGPATWSPVADRLTAEGYQVRVPSLLHVGAGEPPFWPTAAEAVRADLRGIPTDHPLVLVAHSNAGLFLPAVRSVLDHPVAASVFVDAALPARSGPTPVAPPELLELLRPMAVNGILPRWTDWWDEADIAPMFSDPAMRRKVVAEQPRLPLAYYEQHIPVPAGWDDHPCSYLLFGPPYEETAAEARARGWRTAHLPGEHLHQTVDPAGTARQLIELTAGEARP